MERLHIDDFPNYFKALHGHVPMDWQVRMARLACEGDWPDVVDLPTGAGKTSCLDIAAFALSFQADQPPETRTAPLRTFLVVDRRIVVDDAYRRAARISGALSDALRREPQTILGKVASRLAYLSGDNAKPITAYQLRGGIYRETAWVKSARQPMLITSTVDQVGSRLLFRGYGVSEASRPIHASIVGCDSLILLDEAHCSKAFAQTLRAARIFQSESFSKHVPQRPTRSVEMTATPSTEVEEGRRFSLTDSEKLDRNSLLGKRLYQSKPTEVRVVTKAKGKKSIENFAIELATTAIKLVSDQRKAIAVVVNRIATAKSVYERLKSNATDNARIELMIGRMRPIDRDAQSVELSDTISSSTRLESRPEHPLFVVATQCIEVGADLDFDAMVSEAAPLDALRQRFGRLNRTAREIETQAVVLIQETNRKTEQQIEELNNSGKRDDPVYGNSLARTWNALWETSKGDEESRQTDFGIAAMDDLIPKLEQIATREGLTTTSLDAPVLLPAHLDLLCQTSPVPWPDPDVSLWLHGMQRASADVQVCWRADLPAFKNTETWAQAVSLCPPSSPECMQVPIAAVKRWLVGEEGLQEEGSDLPISDPDEGATRQKGIVVDRQPLRWRGLKDSELVVELDSIRPGDTLVLPISARGWNELGFVPQATYNAKLTAEELGEDERRSLVHVDRSEDSYGITRGRDLVKLYPELLSNLGTSEAANWLRDLCYDANLPFTRDELRQAIKEIVSDDVNKLASRLMPAISNRFTIDRYINQAGLVFTSLVRGDAAELLEDDGLDSLSERGNGRVTLTDHLADVEAALMEVRDVLLVGDRFEAMLSAARMHDWGKADARFQAMLIRGSLQSAYQQPCLWAKSDSGLTSRQDWNRSRERSQLPIGFRHEMLSTQLAANCLQETDESIASLILHLIATHHGYGRPFAPTCDDPLPIDVEFSIENSGHSLSSEWRQQHAPEKINSGIAQRFWLAVREYGWWGIAYLETLFRLADQRASARPKRVLDRMNESEEANN